TVEAGMAIVDEARLIFADADALGAWEHDRPLDGLADFVFWGQDAGRLARETGAPALADGQWGWLDRPPDEGLRLGTPAGETKARLTLALGTDFRPHSHNWQLMRQVWASPTQAGTVDIGGARMCGFATSWGDGIFPVLCDLDAEDRLVRVCADLGCDEIVE